MTDRLEALSNFVAEAGYDPSALTLIAGDASNRKYYRMPTAHGTRIVMNAPPDKGEDVRPFVQIAHWLSAQRLSAPQIFEADVDQGFLILEDLGDALFARLLENGSADAPTLYRAAADVLLQIHRAPTPDLAQYSDNVMSEMAALAGVWYRSGITGEDAPDINMELRKQMQSRLSELNDLPLVLIQRDYHAENLIWLPERSGVARVGLLDFQDAMLGHPAYDLVSILQDARRDVSPEIQQDALSYFVAQSRADDSFIHAYALLGLQRNLRILGVFARLCMRDGKPNYVDLIPRVWGHIQTSLAMLDDRQLSDMVQKLLPEPNAANLAALKARGT